MGKRKVSKNRTTKKQSPFIKGVHYILIPELPSDQRMEFRKWLWGQTQPVVTEEGPNQYDCAYKWDYDFWLEYKRKGVKNPPILD